MRKMKESELDMIFDNVNHVIREELKPFDIYPTHIAVLGRNVGIKGDRRLHGWTLTFGASSLYDKSPIYLQLNLLMEIEQRIVSEIQEITIVLYDIPDNN